MDIQQPSFSEFTLLLALLSGTVLFTLYWFVYASDKLRKNPGIIAKKIVADNFIIFTKYLGFVLMGLVPFGLFLWHFGNWDTTLSSTGLVPVAGKTTEIWIWTLATGLPVIILSYFSAGSSAFQAKYPEVRINEWTKMRVAKYAMSWFFYLLGYEYLFRGILFIVIASVTGFWIAFAVNIAIYTFTHIPKGADEAAGAAVIGIVLCFSAWYTQSIWPAFFIHVIMAWSGNFFAIKRNKEFRIV